MQALCTVYTKEGGSTDAYKLWIPLSGPIETAALKEARFRIQRQSSTLAYAPGVQFSNDGITWEDPAFLKTGTAGTYAPSWSTATIANIDFVDLVDDFAMNADDNPEEKVFVRFGVWTKNNSGSLVNSAQLNLNVTGKPLNGGTVTSFAMATPTGGDNSGTPVPLFTPLSGPIATAAMGAVRVSFEMTGSPSGVTSRPGYQLSDDGVTWAAAQTLGSATRTADGIEFDSSWHTPSLVSSSFVRFGMWCENSASNANRRFCVSAMRVDWRQSA